MFPAYLIFSVLTFLTASLWLYRLYRASTQVRRLLSGPSPDSILLRVREFLNQAIDRNLLLQSGPGGLGDVEISLREGHDPVYSALDLMNQIARNAQATTPSEQSLLIKNLYQLQHALNATPSDLNACLQPVLARIQGSTYHGKEVGEVEVIHVGDLVDHAYMFPLTTGLRVQQPLGIVVRDREGRVISKGKVYCAE